MLKTYRYRLYPTKCQTRALIAQLDECRWLYNHFLEERKAVYENTGKGIGYCDQQRTLPILKINRPSLARVYSQVLQNVAKRVDRAFQSFYRRLKSGKPPGYPRFRGWGRYSSITFPQAPKGCEVRNGRLRLSKVGAVAVVLHRKLEGKPKTCTIRRTCTGKWYAHFSCEVQQPRPMKRGGGQIGIDLGLASFAVFSSGESIDNPRFFRTDEKSLIRAQRRLCGAEKGTTERARRRKTVARIHERITSRRQDFAHQLSRKLVNRFDFIAVEDLNVKRMLRNRRFAKSIGDAAWSMFFTLLVVKAEWAGRTVVKVNPAYTSQDCSRCGHRQKMPLSERVYRCPCCRLVLNRDHNAACNVLKIGLGQQVVGPTPKRPKTVVLGSCH